MIKTKGKVILINPGIELDKVNDPSSSGMFPNNAIQVLGTILHQNDFEIIIIDGRYVSPDETIRQVLEHADEELIFVGFSIMTIQVRWSYYVSCGIKKARKDITTVWGGVHPTLFPEQTVSDEAIDICIVDQCAATIVSITTALGDKSDLSELPGIYYKDAKKIQGAPPNTIPDDFTNIPFIDFSIMNHKVYSRNNNIALDSSVNNEFRNHIVYPINTGLGCSFKCNFCINVILDRKYKMRTAEEIIDRIKFLKHEYGANYIHMNDENFFGNKKRTRKFVELLLKENLNVKWRPSIRANYFNENYINESFLKDLERSGMVIAVIGAESASQRILDLLKKNISVEDIKRAVRMLSQTRIIPRMSFMVGLPGESEDEMRETFKLVAALKEQYQTFQPGVYAFRLYPGSELYDTAIKDYDYKPPQTLLEWAEYDEDKSKESAGYRLANESTWIKDPKGFDLRNRVSNIFRMTSCMVSPHVVNPTIKSKIRYLFFYILYKLSIFRLKRNFYRFNLEFHFLRFLKKV